MTCNDADSHPDSGIHAERIVIRGIVQGVGFRPFVYALARDLGLAGSVINSGEGVEVVVQGSGTAVSRFKERLIAEPPFLARITGIRSECVDPSGTTDFRIEASRMEGGARTLVSPDVAVCDACRSEMLDPTNRRFAYPFTNCTNCGPRFTIVRSLPYDRDRTTMAPFPMCPSCRNEYEDPGDRRFHTQATCCPVCGPKVWLVDPGGNPVEGDSAIRTAASMIRQGRIVAVKGIGGFHFAVDARNGSAVARLRELKARGDKPFALMAETVDEIRRFAEVSPEEEAELRTLARPIVLLKKRNEGYGGPGGIVPNVSPSNTMIGVMLPYAPLHVLLFGEGVGVLVMTSANRKGDPVFCDNDDALDHLAGMADAFLLHDRGIHIRSDDSVGRMIDGRFRLIRRARGYAPHPIGLTGPAPDILATGGSMKNTVCVIKDRSAFMGPHIGDLENPAGFRFFHEAAAHMQALFDVNPEAVVHDLHPDFVSRGLAGPGEKIDAQHHHAHIVSCMVENGCEGDVIGFAFDGTGYGEDGAVWGGEVLLASHARYTRAAHVDYVAMPGGAAAVNEPWRMGISWLHHTFGPAMESLDIPLLNGEGVGSDPETNRTLVRMIEKRFNAPLTSSMGRLFDAVAAIMGLCRVNSFDGQAAMMLEMCATGDEPGYDVGPVQLPDGGGAVDMRPLIRAVVRDLESRAEPGVIAARFHSTLIGMFTGIGEELARKTGIRTAALSGGVFQNARLLTGLTHALAEKGFTVLTQAQVPSNDGGLSLGQAGIAAALCRERKNHDV